LQQLVVFFFGLFLGCASTPASRRAGVCKRS